MDAPGWGTVSQHSPADGVYPIDPLLEDFYEDLQGSTYLGPAISKLVERDGLQCQYTINALLCYDPAVSGASAYHLAPLGLGLGIEDQPRAIPGINSPRVADGFSVYPEFISVYDALFGSLHVGRPLSNPIYNEEQDRIEQYFENVGFYKNTNDPEGVVYLLEYGAYFCDEECRFSVGNFIIDSANPSDDPQSLFGLGIEYLGGTQIFGEPLTELHIAADGSYEQIFENAVFFATQENPGNVQLRQLPILIGIAIAPPKTKTYDLEDNMLFYTTNSEQQLGYHVPIIFDEFISNHGGPKLTGNPINDPAYYEGVNVPRQCFENVCLDYHKTEAGIIVKIAPLGLKYLEQNPVTENLPEPVVTPEPQATASPAPEVIAFIMSEVYTVLGNQDVQTFQVMVFDNQTRQPLANIRPELKIFLPPNNVEQSYIFDPTNENGMTNLSIAPLSNIQQNELVNYQVCLSFNDYQNCVSDTFMVLGEP